MSQVRPNVLIMSAARKVLLVEAFRRAISPSNSALVLCADVNPLSAALYAGDGARLISSSDAPDFIDRILGLCEADAIGLVVPTRDEELPVFAHARERFTAAGTLVLVSPPEAILTCQDKLRFATAVRAAGLDAPAEYPGARTAPLPAFVKPRRGKGGQGAAKATTRQGLLDAVNAVNAVNGEALIQEFIDAPEFSVDVFIDLDGRPISCVPRERVAVVGGESIISRTVRDPELVKATLRLCTAIGLVGHLTVQAFRTPDRISFIEINPRYGGAANLGFQAGASTPEFALAVARGEHPTPRLDDYEAGLVMLRYSTDRFLREEDLLGAGGR